jgi:TctA family transporter
MMVGVLLGILVGVLPGLGAPNGVSLLLPLTFTMDPVAAIILLTSMYWGALFGGSTTSILFNIPGEPSSVATTFDGYPMARQGQATQALTLAFLSAGFGALVGVILITVLSTWVAKFALRFSSPEYFAVIRARVKVRDVLKTIATLPRYWVTLLRSAAIGCWMGVTPGGPTAASFMSYGLAKRLSQRHPADARSWCSWLCDSSCHDGRSDDLGP